MKPSEFIGDRSFYDNTGQMIFAEKGTNLQLILDVRAWGAIQHLFKNQTEAAKFQDELGAWIAEAINEKLQREQSPSQPRPNDRDAILSFCTHLTRIGVWPADIELSRTNVVDEYLKTK